MLRIELSAGASRRLLSWQGNWLIMLGALCLGLAVNIFGASAAENAPAAGSAPTAKNTPAAKNTPIAATARPTADLRVSICDPYLSPLTGAGWEIPKEVPETELPKIEAQMVVPPALASRSPTLDGRLKEAVWNTAPAALSFRFCSGGEIEPARAQTLLRILQDDTALYIGVVCNDERIQNLERDGAKIKEMLKDNALEISIDPEANLADASTTRFFRIPALGRE